MITGVEEGNLLWGRGNPKASTPLMSEHVHQSWGAPIDMYASSMAGFSHLHWFLPNKDMPMEDPRLGY